VMMEEEASRFLVNYGQGNRKAMRYMTMTDNVTDAFREIAPAATHIDNTARPQVVGKEDNPSLFKLLSEYKKLSGHGIIINTSFNIHEEPIVCSPDDAIIAFLRAGLDVLSMGNFIVMKENLNEY